MTLSKERRDEIAYLLLKDQLHKKQIRLGSFNGWKAIEIGATLSEMSEFTTTIVNDVAQEAEVPRPRR
ncbi:MAG: hypothetical protein AAB690_01205 [Patescibacteria group bacterium]